MGSDNMHCRDTEIGDEMLEDMIKQIPLHNVPVTESFESYKSCLEENEDDYGGKTFYLDYSKFCEFLNPLISSEGNKYRLEQLEYFDNVRRVEQGTEVLGLLLILLSNGSKIQQIQYACELYTIFHEELSRTHLNKLINGIICSFSELALISFGTTLPSKENNKLSQVYTASRQRELTDYLMKNFDSLYVKRFKEETPTQEACKMTNNKNKQLINRFYELIFSNLNGSFIRNWLNDEYLKEKPKLINPCDWCGD